LVAGVGFTTAGLRLLVLSPSLVFTRLSARTSRLKDATPPTIKRAPGPFGFRGFLMVAGVGFDLQVMSLTSYRAAPSRVKYVSGILPGSDFAFSFAEWAFFSALRLQRGGLLHPASILFCFRYRVLRSHEARSRLSNSDQTMPRTFTNQNLPYFPNRLCGEARPPVPMDVSSYQSFSLL